ncbi:glycogen/starch synthase [Marispirochaeta aestuarii]|uniref:glycogen/starch synthase n=2 Tax=Marispirochaeta aestuarii TaxID=1963862 RepID=UPI002ABE6963|nr:glycogen/starch synthase [Marispirochaeta aestuarii]
MRWSPSELLPSALLRFREDELGLVSASDIEYELQEAASQFRSFAFIPDLSLAAGALETAGAEDTWDTFIPLRNRIIDEASVKEPSVKRRFYSQGRIPTRLLHALVIVHRAVQQLNNPLLPGRRFVLIKERPGSPTIFHLSPETSLLSYVNAGPPEQEQPSIYLGLNLLDVVITGLAEGDDTYYQSFLEILKIEERAIETGYTHTEGLTEAQKGSLDQLLDKIISLSEVFQSRPEPLPGKTQLFSPQQREQILVLLDSRLPGDSGLFNYDDCRRGIDSLEKFAREYKSRNKEDSLREVVRLLTAASGHDIHEVRNRANIALERVFAPKEYDAPLATRFETILSGSRHRFSFSLPKSRSGYFVRVYGDRSSGELVLDGDLDYTDLPLRQNPATGRYEASRLFRTLGNYDWVVFRKLKNGGRWLDGFSGRINVLPDLDGELVLEIFPDIHGHTRLYWRSENPGMVYNERGQIIRTGTFTDVAAHLEDIKTRYNISAVYILGAQKRGSNREDWAPEAQSPSPFAPMSMTELEPKLGGEEAFTALVAEAHRLGIKVIVDVIPHLNRHSRELPDEYAVRTYDEGGNLVVRASTDGRYGSWNDGKLLNYRKFAVWQWLADSVCTLIEKYDIDGIRFDSAHAVPVMMKRNNYPFIHGEYRSRESLVEGDIIDNTREYDHLVTTSYYDSSCAELIAVPFHYYLSLRVHRLLRRLGKRYFVNLAECYWGREQYLSRTGTVPYNSSLFKICENIIHGKTDVREIYHIYQNYFPSILPPGAQMLGILGNHDERRALNTFGRRGYRAAVMLTSFLSSIILDFEGSAEGESWKVFLDNIYVNWNDFEREAYRGTVDFYTELYNEHRNNRGPAYLVWAGNPMVAAALRFNSEVGYIGAFNFADRDENASIRFDDPRLPLEDEAYYHVSDPIYSAVTGLSGWYTGAELRHSRVEMLIPHTDRYKVLVLRRISTAEERKKVYPELLRQSIYRLCSAGSRTAVSAALFYNEMKAHAGSYREFTTYISKTLAPLMQDNPEALRLGLKRFLYYLWRDEADHSENPVWAYLADMRKDADPTVRETGEYLQYSYRGGSLVFLSAEADPFSKSGGLANVVYELPRELANMGESAVVITPLYRQGDAKSVQKMEQACRRYNVSYTGRNVRFWILDQEYEAGVHTAMVDGIRYYLLEHHEFFDGLYYGVTGAERLRRRVALSRAAAELVREFSLDPLVIFTNDAYSGIFSAIVRSDPRYAGQPVFDRASLVHIIHNGGWQYFDAYRRWEAGNDLFRLFNLAGHEYWRFEDPQEAVKINCMAAGIRSANKVVTVSPSYAKQIQIASDGMEKILHDVSGINNGVGGDFRKRALQRLEEEKFLEKNIGALYSCIEKDPLLKKQLKEKYAEILVPGEIEELKQGRRRRLLERLRIKLLLQLTRGLQVDPDTPLFVMIHRLTEQKGFQLLLEASEGVFTTLGYQGIIGGAVAGGDERGDEIARGLMSLKNWFPGQVSVGIGFQDVRIPLLGADLFLMPSMHEPGGISQLEAFACGCFVCARATGGLRDTVHGMVKEKRTLRGNGVLFSDYSAVAFYDAMQRFHQIYSEESPETLESARQRMEKDIFSWRKPAENYRDLVYSMKEIIPLGGNATLASGSAKGV